MILRYNLFELLKKLRFQSEFIPDNLPLRWVRASHGYFELNAVPEPNHTVKMFGLGNIIIGEKEGPLGASHLSNNYKINIIGQMQGAMTKAHGEIIQAPRDIDCNINWHTLNWKAGYPKAHRLPAKPAL